MYGNSAFLHVEFFIQAIKDELINKDNFSLLNFSKIDDELAYFLQSTEVVTLNLEAKTIIAVAKGRVKSVYGFLQDVFAGKVLQQCLTELGMSEIRDLFLQQTDEIGLLDVFFYYEIRDQLDDFYSFLTPEFQQKIAAAFRPSQTDSLVTKPEMTKLQQIVRVGVPLSTHFIPAVIICDIFQTKVPILPFSEAEIAGFASNFAGLEIFDETQRTTIDNQMRGLLSISEIDLHRDHQQIIDFFTMILGAPTVDELSNGNKKEIVEFFKKSRTYIAHLFKQEGGIRSFLSCIHTISDGCSANIGTQISIALYGAMLPNFMDSLLLQYFVEYVATPLFENRIIGDAIGSDSNPFENDKVRDSHLSAPGIMTQTTQLFYDSNLSNPIKRNPLDFLCESFELKKLVAEGTILATDLDLFQPALYDFKTEIFELTDGYEKTAQIASYLTIETVVGDEFTRRFLDASIILLAQETKQLIADTKPVIMDYVTRLPELRLAREQRIAEENRNRPAASTTGTGARKVNSNCCTIS